MSIFQGVGRRFSTGMELLAFFGRNKWWWLTPMLVALFGLGLMLFFVQASAVAPFIYTLF